MNKQRWAAPPDRPTELSNIELRYGSVVRILVEMGFRGSTSEHTFNDYIKSLRKLGLPVSSKTAPRKGHAIIYSFENVMDLVLAFLLRVYNGVPDAVLRQLVEARPELHRLYWLAYRDRCSGLGSPFRIGKGDGSFEIAGVFLDLKLNHAGGRLVGFGPPVALSPMEAFARFAQSDITSRAFLPMRLSELCERVAGLARQEMMNRRADG